MRTSILAFILCCSLGCYNYSYDPIITDPGDTDSCSGACVRLRALSCPEGEPLRDGTTCESFCIQTQRQGHALRPSCVVNIQRCDDISRCQ